MSRGRGRNVLIASTLAVGALLAAPAAALAASVSFQGGVIYYAAATGEKNALTFSDGALNTFLVTDTGAPLTTDATCIQVDPNMVQCPAADQITVELGNKDDSAANMLSELGTGVTMHGGPGNDKLTGGAGPDALDGGPGADVLHGGGGIDNAIYTAATGPVSITLDGVANDGVAGEGDNVGGDIENLYGSAFADTIIANGGNNTIYGNGGADTMDGGGGNDVFFIDGANVIDGGTGFDTVEYFGSEPWNVSLDGNANDGTASDHANVHSGIEMLEGGSGADTLIGDSKANYLLGMGGDDKLVGKSGDDTLNGGDGSDVCKGGGGSNTFITCETTS